jgi:acyl carrier protein
MNTFDTLRDLVSQHVEPPADPQAPLELDSFALVVLAEALEDRFGIRVRPTEVVPENFGTLASLAAWIEGKRA